jgi:hypothetical protein
LGEERTVSVVERRALFFFQKESYVLFPTFSYVIYVL